MGEEGEIRNLSDLLDQLEAAAEDRETVSIRAVLEGVGQRAFGPVLLVPGLIALSPLSGIPGIPTTVGMLVLLIAGQILLGRSELWLPDFLLRRSVSRDRFDRAIGVLRPVARFVDRLLRPRLESLTKGAAVYVIAALCLLLSLTAPLLEILPFAISGVGAAVSTFGLALIANDGVLALVAFGACIAVGIAAAVGLLC